jgi:hypothetical protein
MRAVEIQLVLSVAPPGGARSSINAKTTAPEGANAKPLSAISGSALPIEPINRSGAKTAAMHSNSQG